MADIVQILQAFPPEKKKLNAKEYESHINNHLTALGLVSPSGWTRTLDKKSLLDFLDPQINSVSYLVALNKQKEAYAKDTQRSHQLYVLALNFFATFDPVQVRYSGDHWRDLFDWTLHSLCSLQGQSPTPDISPLVRALLRLDPSAGTFTTHHLQLVRACLSLGVPSQVLPILDSNLYAFPTKANRNAPDEVLHEDHQLSNAYITEKSGFSLAIRAEYVLEYYLLGAQIYIAMRRFSRARLFLEYILLSPSQQHTPSALQVEAYKKWVLVGLLAEGKSWPVPRTMDQVVLKSVRAMSKAYDALADDFEKRDSRKFQAELEEWGQQAWQEDGNLRLVAEVSQALPRYRVIDLQKTYSALPVTRVAALLETHPAGTMQLLAEMIRAGYLDASVSGAGTEAVLRFKLSSTASPGQFSDLEAQTQQIQQLVTYVRDADRRLQLTKEYVEYQKRSKRTGGPDGDLADAMDLTWDGPMAMGTAQQEGSDEDIMAT